ncbi:MAG: helix-turn-helix domain-containing protein [Promethearchaeota archaeon]
MANKLGVTWQTVYNLIKEWNEDGLNGILLKKQSGAPKILTEQECLELIQDILHNPRDLGYEFSIWILKAIAAHMYARFNKVMTLGGVHTMLERNNIRSD